MIFRLAQTVADKLHVDSLSELPLSPEPLTDWSVRLFKVSRTQWYLFVNTSALFAFVVPAKGLGTPTQIVSALVAELDLYLAKINRHERSADELVQSQQIVFAKTLSRSVTGSITDLVKLAQSWLEDGHPVEEVTPFLQRTPMLTMGPCRPQTAFALLLGK